MGGFFGVASKNSAISDIFFGTDYHSHLGSHRAGVATFDSENGLQRIIHNIENTPFRAKFEKIFEEMSGNSAIGCISDNDPQPLLIRSKIGSFAICVIGIVNNAQQLIDEYLFNHYGHFDSMTGGKVNTTELVASLISQKDNFVDGIKFMIEKIDGTANILILKDDAKIIAVRDKYGRLPVMIGKNDDGYCVSFESFAYHKLDYIDEKELGPGEIVEISHNCINQLSPPLEKMRICSFLWSYYGYPTSNYEGINVEMMRYKNGTILAQYDRLQFSKENIDYVGGVPDSGTPHAIGYSNESHIPFARAFIKYTPTWSRSFTPTKQSDRSKIAKMKQIPVKELICNKSLLFVDDSIVRGTQLKETVDFLYEQGAKSVHIRSACPPIMYPCKYLNFSRSNSDMELISRQIIVELEGQEGLNYIDEYSDASTKRGQNLLDAICKRLHLASIAFQSLEGLVKAIGLDEDKLCTYCWNKKE